MKKSNTVSIRINKFLVFVGLVSVLLMSGKQSYASELDTLSNFWQYTSGQSIDNIQTISIDSSGFIYLSIWSKGIMRSTNQGDSWVDITNDLPYLNITAIEFDSTGKIYLGTMGGGVFVSSNNGNSWTAVNNGLTNKRVTALKIQRGGPIYVGTVGGGVFRSTNGGQLWTQQNYGLRFWNITAMTLNNQGGVIVGTPNDGVYRSTDMGANWSRANGNITSRYVTSFAKNSAGELAVGTLGGGVCLSVDGGGGWTEIKKSNLCENVTALVFVGNNEPVAGLVQDGIVRYDPNVWYDWRKTGLQNPGVTALTRSANNTLWAALPLRGLYKSTDKGVTWTYVNFSRSLSMLKVFGMRDGYALATKRDTTLWLSDDYGRTWKDGNLPNHKITSFGMDSSGNFLVGALEMSEPPMFHLYRSNNNGQSWNSVFSKRDTNITAIGVSPDGTIFCGLAFPPASPMDPNSIANELYMSTNNGITWWHVNVQTKSPGFQFISINYNGDIYVNQKDGLYRSSDNGGTWNKVIDENTVMVYAVGFTSNRDVYAATDIGVFKSTNNGQNWLSNDFGQANPAVETLIVTQNDQIIAGMQSTDGFYLSTNAGLGYFPINRGFIHTYQQSLSQSKDGYIYMASNTIYRAVEAALLEPPTLLSPAHDAEGVSRKATFSWENNPKADMYEFQLSHSPDFVVIDEKVILGATSYSLRYELEPNTLYYWRVRSRTNNAMGDWSNLRIFTSEIDKPVLISPKNLSGSHPTEDLLLTWHSVPLASIYVFELATDAGFANIVTSTEIPDTTIIVSGLELYKKYYWRVKGKTFKTFGPWSDTWAFFTKLRPPTLKAPANGSTGLPIIVKMEWNLTPGGDKYEIQIAKDSLFNSMVFEGITDNNNSQTSEILEYFTTYWWRIRGLNDEGTSDWSEAWKFTTTITAPKLVMPFDKANDQKQLIKFKWEEDTLATTYHLIVSTNAGFSNIIWQDSTLTSASIDISAFDYFTTYYWKVRKYSGTTPGLWSDTWSFTTGIGKVSLISPEDNLDEQPLNMIFKWYVLNGADEYIFHLAKDEQFDDIIRQAQIPETQIEVTGLQSETTYFFKVKGKYDKGEGEWSDIRKFTTKKVEAGVDYSAIPGLSELSAHPNPFINNLHIAFELASDAEISIYLADMNGIIVSSIFNGIKPAGSHSIEYIPKELSSGNYLVIMTINSKQAVKQVIYIK